MFFACVFKQYFALVVITSSVFTPLYLDKTSPAPWHSYLLIFHLVCISLIWTICITGKNNCFTGPFFLKKAGPSGRFESSAKDLSQQTSFLQEAGSSVWHMTQPGVGGNDLNHKNKTEFSYWTVPFAGDRFFLPILTKTHFSMTIFDQNWVFFISFDQLWAILTKTEFFLPILTKTEFCWPILTKTEFFDHFFH